MLNSFLSIFFSISAQALVDMKNANYTNVWTDMDVPGSGYELKVQRAYNSRSLFNGLFGFGWCSEFETSLEITAEGNIKVRECGSGVEVVYSPKEISPAEVNSTIDKIVSALRAERKVGLNEDYIKSLRQELLEDDDLRMEMAGKYKISVPVREGTRFRANGIEVEYFVFEKTHYTRHMPDGSKQRFDIKGRLIAKYDKFGNYLKLIYEGENLRTVEDNNGRKLNFFYVQGRNKVSEIRGPGNLKVTYSYVNLDDLSSVVNAWGNKYTYEYDELHNLTKATWPDNTFISIRYDTKNDWVISFTDRDKCVENYTYEFSKTDPKNNYWATVKKTCANELVSENRYEFWHKQRPDGQVYLSKVQQIVNGEITEVTYHEIFGKPLTIRRNNQKTSFDYYPDGLVKTKSTPSLKLTFKYHPENKKVTQVESQFYDEKGKPTVKRVSTFDYDEKGNITTAKNSDGMEVRMTFDSKGRISTITDHAKRTVLLEYDERFGKQPVKVTRPGVGTITIKYNAKGEIQDVQSPDGLGVATQVASTFNNLLDVVAPASTDLYL